MIAAKHEVKMKSRVPRVFITLIEDTPGGLEAIHETLDPEVSDMQKS